MAVFGELRKKLYQEECAARLDELCQRKQMSADLRKKSMQFWNIAIQRLTPIECDRVSIINMPKTVESEASNVV